MANKQRLLKDHGGPCLPVNGGNQQMSSDMSGFFSKEKSVSFEHQCVSHGSVFSGMVCRYYRFY